MDIYTTYTSSTALLCSTPLHHVVPCPSSYTVADFLLSFLSLSSPPTNRREAAQLESEPGPLCFPATRETPPVLESRYAVQHTGSAAGATGGQSGGIPPSRSGKLATSFATGTPDRDKGQLALKQGNTTATASTGSSSIDNSSSNTATHRRIKEETSPVLLQRSQPSFLRDMGDSTIHTPTQEQILDPRQFEAAAASTATSTSGASASNRNSTKPESKGEQCCNLLHQIDID